MERRRKRRRSHPVAQGMLVSTQMEYSVEPLIGIQSNLRNGWLWADRIISLSEFREKMLPLLKQPLPSLWVNSPIIH